MAPLAPGDAEALPAAPGVTFDPKRIFEDALAGIGRDPRRRVRSGDLHGAEGFRLGVCPDDTPRLMGLRRATLKRSEHEDQKPDAPAKGFRWRVRAWILR